MAGVVRKFRRATRIEIVFELQLAILCYVGSVPDD